MTGTALAVAGWLGCGLVLAALLRVRYVLAGRSEAVAWACHEVRGPLAAVRLGLEWHGLGSGLPRSHLRALELELARATVALQDLEGAHRLRPPADSIRDLLDVCGWLTESVEAWRPAAADRDIELRLNWRGPSAKVWGERARLAQATGNLIANAIEHGGGHVEVLGRVEQRVVRIEVRDGGPGLAFPLPELLRRGRRRARDRRRGRGLAIAQSVAEAHGGSLTAAPSHQGARLVLELPLAGSASEAA